MKAFASFNRIFFAGLIGIISFTAYTQSDSLGHSSVIAAQPVNSSNKVQKQTHSSDTTVVGEQAISEQIKLERDKQLKALSDQLKKNEEEVARLTNRLSSINEKKTAEKINAMEDLQLALDSRLKILEERPRTRTNLNGQLAFTELLSIQRDIQPADLFLTSQTFFTQLGDLTNLQNYQDFSTWKEEYDKWYARQSDRDQMEQMLNNSINLISNVSNNVPLYGSIVQSVSYGITAMVTSLNKKDRKLANETPKMLNLLNSISQFSYQKSMIDNEWEEINEELFQLKNENHKLLKEQMQYYGLDSSLFRSNYLEETLDNVREDYKNKCRKAISDKLLQLDCEEANRGKWMSQVEVYMYKVQALRLRFGHLTLRMIDNIDRYRTLIGIYSDPTKFPAEFTHKLVQLQTSLNAVQSKFYASFNPEKYIEESSVMYIER